MSQQAAAKRERSSRAGNDAERMPQPRRGLTRREEKARDEHVPLRAAVLYEIIRIEGEGELARPAHALWWSGLAAGLSIGFSVIAQGLITSHLPDTQWRPLVASFGYPVGFLIVILGRQQLFSEATLMAVLPVITRRSWKWALVMLRLWAVVLAANLVGCLIFAAVLAYTDLLAPEVREAIFVMGTKMLDGTVGQMFIRAVAAGWLIAAIVWILPVSEGGEFVIITVLTYLVALGGLTHIGPAAAEVFYLWLYGQVTLLDTMLHFFVPVTLGNLVGGTSLFAVLAHVQVQSEV